LSTQIDIRGAVRKGGFLEDYLGFVKDFEYPESYAILAMLTMASCLVDKRVLINPGAKPELWTNIYVLLYGPSGARKSDALLDAHSVMSEAFENAPQYPMNFSMEGLRNLMVKDSAELGRTSGLVLAEELSTLLGGRDYLLNNSLFLGKVWDGRKQETFMTVAHQLQVVKNSYLVIGGCSTPEAFSELDPKALGAGFLRRLIICTEHDKKCSSERPMIDMGFVDRVLVPKLRARFGSDAIDPKGVLMRLSPRACELNREWYNVTLDALRQQFKGPREQRFVDTMQAHAFKLGALIHLIEGDDPQELSAQSLSEGIRVMELLRPGIFEAYGGLVPTPFAKLRAAVVRIAATGQPISDRELDEAVWKEVGVTPEIAAQARLSLLAELDNPTLYRAKDGKLRVK